MPEFVKTIIAELASNRHKKSPESVAAVPRHNNYIHGGPKKWRRRLVTTILSNLVAAYLRCGGVVNNQIKKCLLLSL